MTSRYLQYVRNESKDFNFQLFEEFKNTHLERKHDYIQWVFPLAESSMFNGFAPVLNLKELKRMMEKDPLILERHLFSVRKMLHFWGIDWEEGIGTTTGKLRVHNWFSLRKLNSDNHNALRFSRMLRSMVYHGQSRIAKKILLFLLSPALQHGVRPGKLRNSQQTHWEVNFRDAMLKMRGI